MPMAQLLGLDNGAFQFLRETMKFKLVKRPILKRILVVISALLLLVTCLALVYRQNIRNYRQGIFVDAALNGNIARMNLLMVLGANVDEPACQTSLCAPPIVAAAFNEDPTAVRLLLERGANVNGRMKRGQTALMIASYRGYTNIVRLLLSRGADVNADFEGDTALAFARQKSHGDVADLLIKSGATK